ncbi:type VI secretion system-associated protein TagF [Burkholderia sp. WSM2232]|uniref:type VI secretion system-associated protein TagF n=1 Tax=Burkholderia sp. WSM2232 TaxID=944436 RepID=UPI0004196110|nr:type VI secretion system-associated protein TagF [Burkholderia sp. WSM2232]
MSGAVGFYGKLPGAGDFVRRRLPADFVDAWDRHFQRAVEIGRRETGERWTDAWQHAPAWRFVLPSQVCGNGSWCGLAGPAVDRVGRAFPTVLAAPCSGDVARLFGNPGWFDALERVYRSAQGEAVSVETFDARVVALPRPFSDARDLAALWRELPWDSGQWELGIADSTCAGLILSEAWRQLCMRPGPWCLWWTAGAARLLATRGLPRDYAALLGPSRRPVQQAYGLHELNELQGLQGPQHQYQQYQQHQEYQPYQRHEHLPRADDRRNVAASDAFSAPGIHASDAATATTPSALASGPSMLPSSDSAGLALRTAATGSAIMWLDNGNTLLVSADDGPPDPGRVAARCIRETVLRNGPDTRTLRAGLMSLHERLRDLSHDLSHDLSRDFSRDLSHDLSHDLSRDFSPETSHKTSHEMPRDLSRHSSREPSRAVIENGAAVLVCFEGASASVLRVGAAAAWHWRSGRLLAPFVERAAGAGGELDDLLFGDAWLDMPGIGAGGDPGCDEAALSLQRGDRLLLLATRQLTRLSRDCLATALALPTCDDARAYLASVAGLRAPPSEWPLAVVEIGA